ncbi:MAG: hypothetical protein EA425_05690 [Puniceicoccaceae bacterium]|nr:MAG: hypothetical protein EA425_05690 [Puniceicoccaceae bacterium]
MDNHTAKEILSAYRPNGADAEDPNFRAALQHCERDPAMKAWLADQEQFDRRFADALADIRGPAKGRESILATLPFSREVTAAAGNRRSWLKFTALGLAALLVLSAVYMGSLLRLGPSLEPGEFALSRLAGSIVLLDYRASDVTSLQTWLHDRGAPVPGSLPEALALASAVGCKVFSNDRGGQISVLCVKIEGNLVHIFVFDDQTRDLLDAPRGQWWQENNYNLIAWEDNATVMAVATRAEPLLLPALL